MDRETWLKYFEASPQAVQDYLLDPAATEREKRAQTALGYENDAWDRLMDVVWDIVFAKLSRQDAQERFKRLAGDRKADDVERQVLLHVVLPLSDMVAWDVESRLQEMGVPMADIQSAPRVMLRPISYGSAVKRMATKAKISLMTEEAARRLRDAFVSYVKGVRSIEQFKETLERSQTESGLGFTPPQAEAFVQAMQEMMDSTRILSEQEYAAWYSEFQNSAQEKKEPAVPVPASEEESIMPAKSAGNANQAELEEAITATMSRLGELALDDYLSKRLRNLISTRLRDVRSASQLRQILEREVKVGGMGFAAEQADATAKAVEASYAEFRQGIAEEEKQRIEATHAQQKQLIDERRKRESEEHAQWYRSKVKATLTQEEQTKQAFQAFQAQAAAARAGAAMPAPKPGAAPLPPTMDTVRAPMRLVGLNEELAGMTMAEFRRLAKTPQDAAGKILQKLKTLQEESFEQWTEGVEAWRQSPLQQQYLKLVTESFTSGKPVTQLVEEKRAADPSLPSGEELSAIIQLNSKIQL